MAKSKNANTDKSNYTITEPPGAERFITSAAGIIVLNKDGSKKKSAKKSGKKK